MIKTELEKLGFLGVEIGPEGSLHLNSTASPPKSFFKGDYNGQDGVYEICGIKN
jgi:hypothetical protein